MAQLIKGTFKAPLSRAIQTEYNKLMWTIAHIPLQLRTQKLIEFTGGKASVADIIGYQIGWGKLLLGWYQAGIQGLMPLMPGEGFEKWDYVGLAHHFYAHYQLDAGKEQEQSFHDTVCAIIAIVEKEHQTGRLDETGRWEWCTLQSGKQWPLSKWITINTVSPYKRATALLKAFLKEQRLSQ